MVKRLCKVKSPGKKVETGRLSLGGTRNLCPLFESHHADAAVHGPNVYLDRPFGVLRTRHRWSPARVEEEFSVEGREVPFRSHGDVANGRESLAAAAHPFLRTNLIGPARIDGVPE